MQISINLSVLFVQVSLAQPKSSNKRLFLKTVSKIAMSYFKLKRFLNLGILFAFFVFLTESCSNDENSGEIAKGPNEISLSKTQLRMDLGGMETLTINEDIGDDTVYWSSTDSSVATVNNGMISALGFGTTSITASVNGKSASCDVEVLLMELQLNQSELSLKSGNNSTLNVTTEIGDANVLWETSNPTIANVVEGVVTALKSGSVIISATVAGVSASCAVTVEPVIYVTGYERVGIQAEAKYWKNGEDITLPNFGFNAFTRAIQVTEEDIYVAGYEFNQSNVAVAKFWKNGVSENLFYDGVADDIQVEGGDVHVVGYELNGSKFVAKYWMNGADINLTDGQENAGARAITIFEGDVYIAGYERNDAFNGGNNVAKYWKNGISVNLSDGSLNEEAVAIQVVNGDVYAAGYEFTGFFNVAKYWRNGTAVNLTNGDYEAKATSIQVVDGDIYVAGYEFNGSTSVAKYWKNGTVVNLSDGTHSAEATSIHIVDGNVYVAGYESNGTYDIAKYWKNGVPFELSKGTGRSKAYDIYVR
tara:strand:+ start:2409 stop:4007 length:1599 start_codon:yes stop_codon:yes gene_type:complete